MAYLRYNSQILRHILMHRSVDKKTGCWLWIGPKGGIKPYPKIMIRGRMFLVSGLLLKLIGRVRRLVTGRRLFHCHGCDDGRCINPDHISIKGPKGNSQDAIIRRRNVHSRKDFCKRGHSLNDPINVRVVGNNRRCRACQRERYRKLSCVPKSRFRGSYIAKGNRLRDIVKRDLVRAMRQSCGDRVKAASNLGISLPTMYRKCHALGMPIRSMRKRGR